MSETTTIEWADITWSPWEGCTKVSPACDNCYAEAMNRWLRGGENWGAGAPRREYSEAHWLKPLAWHNKAVKDGKQPKVFPSVMDPFDNEVVTERRLQFLRVVMHTPRLTWLLLTKRIGNVKRQLLETMTLARSMPGEDELANWLAAWLNGSPPANVWIGATICNQEEADRDIPKLAYVSALVRFLSIEPMLGAVDLRLVTKTWAPGRCDHCCNGDRCDDRSHYDRQNCPHCRGTGKQPVDWVICGGESGRKARPMRAAWAQSLRDQCHAANVPFMFKQWGEWLGEKQDGNSEHEPLELNAGDDPVRVGKKAAGRLLDGRTHDGFPEVH